jgi:DinB superfamily
MQKMERDQVQRLLTESREFLCQTVAGLTAEQRAFKPAPDRWSIGDCIEHTVVVESRVLENVMKTVEAPPPTEKPDTQGKDEVILNQVPKRTTRIQGPPVLMPTGRWPDCDEAIREFEATRTRTLEFATSTQADLRAYSFPHPVLGPLDCYQWLLAIAGHCERHVHQMEEIKTDAAFPSSAAGSAQA